MSLPRVLITGNSLLASALTRTGSGYSLTCTCCNNKVRPVGADLIQMDVTDGASIHRAFEAVCPDVVIHTASIGSVDYAENHREICLEINVRGTQRIVSACRQYGARLVFISTNAIFDGQNAPYSEENVPNPINYYGQLKVTAERLVSEADLPWTIIRPILMYGWHSVYHRPKPVTWLLDALRKDGRVKLVTDIYCNPLWVDNGAEAIWAAVGQQAEGIFHLAGKNRLSRFAFAQETARTFGLDPDLIDPVKNAYFTEIAPRPADTSYVVEKMENVLGIRPLTTQEGLERMWAQEWVQDGWWTDKSLTAEQDEYLTYRTPQLVGAVDGGM